MSDSSDFAISASTESRHMNGAIYAYMARYVKFWRDMDFTGAISILPFARLERDQTRLFGGVALVPVLDRRLDDAK